MQEGALKRTLRTFKCQFSVKALWQKVVFGSDAEIPYTLRTRFQIPLATYKVSFEYAIEVEE